MPLLRSCFLPPSLRASSVVALRACCTAAIACPPRLPRICCSGACSLLLDPRWGSSRCQPLLSDLVPPCWFFPSPTWAAASSPPPAPPTAGSPAPILAAATTGWPRSAANCPLPKYYSASRLIVLIAINQLVGPLAQPDRTTWNQSLKQPWFVVTTEQNKMKWSSIVSTDSSTPISQATTYCIAFNESISVGFKHSIYWNEKHTKGRGCTLNGFTLECTGSTFSSGWGRSTGNESFPVTKALIMCLLKKTKIHLT
jgi:hypothetical protein